MSFIPGFGYVFAEDNGSIRSREAGSAVHVSNIILDPLEECQLRHCIVKESPETVESWRETQEKLGNITIQHQKFIVDTRVKGRPLHQLKEKKR